MSATSDLKSFHYLENGDVSFSILDTIKTQKQLDPGVYKISVNQQTNSIDLRMIEDTETVKMHNFEDKQMLDEYFASFFNQKVLDKMKQLGFNHKGGVLFYGKEGTGKSTIIKSYSDMFIQNNKALVFYIEARGSFSSLWAFIRKVRCIQDNPIVIVFEEIDTLIRNGYEGDLKKCLDGNESIDGSIILATTNYIDRIPDALKIRKSRFKYSLNVEGLTNIDDIADILTAMIGDLFEAKEIREFAIELDGQTLDSVKQFGLDKIMDLSTYDTKKGKKMGFKFNTTGE